MVVSIYLSEVQFFCDDAYLASFKTETVAPNPCHMVDIQHLSHALKLGHLMCGIDMIVCLPNWIETF